MPIENESQDVLKTPKHVSSVMINRTWGGAPLGGTTRMGLSSSHSRSRILNGLAEASPRMATMRAVIRRLRRLEQRSAALVSEQGLTPAQVLRARRRGRAEQRGEPYMEARRKSFAGCRTTAEVLGMGRHRRRERNASRMAPAHSRPLPNSLPIGGHNAREPAFLRVADGTT